MVEITVVIPVYNVEGYLEKCVDSVENQTYTEFEIILVDDGSTDNSGNLCDRLAKKHENITVIHQENKGLGGARNTGISACKTEYIFFLDSDDYIHPELLEYCMKAAKENDCPMVLFDAVSVYEDGTRGVLYVPPVEKGRILNENEKKALISHSGAGNRIYKTSLFTEHDILFPEKVWYEDLRTVPKLIPLCDRIIRVDSEPLYYYLQRQGSIMHTPDFDRLVRERTAAADDIISFFESCGLKEEYDNELQFLWIYHVYLLPLREMQVTGKDYKPYAENLRNELLRHCDNPLDNTFLNRLSKREQKLLKLFVGRKYFTVKCLSAINKFYKKVK